MNSRAVSASMPRNASPDAARPRSPGAFLERARRHGGPGQTSVMRGLSLSRWPSKPLDDPEPLLPSMEPPFILPLSCSTVAWAFSHGPRPARDPARNPSPNAPIVLIRNSFMVSPPGVSVSACQETFPAPGCGKRAVERGSEAGGEPFAAGIRRRGQTVLVDPDQVGVAHRVLPGSEDREVVAATAQAVEHGGREPVLDGHGVVAGVHDPTGRGQGGGGIGAVVDQPGEELHLRLELAVGAHGAEDQPGA